MANKFCVKAGKSAPETIELINKAYGSAEMSRAIVWFRIGPGAWMFVCCECYVLLGRGLCDKLITRPEESYRLWCVVVCDLETS